MKFLVFLAVFLNSCTAFSQSDLKFLDLTEFQQPMPEFRLIDEQTGEYYSTASHTGAAFVFEFYFSSCPYCRDNEENVNRLAEEFKGNDKVQILEISIDCDREQYEYWMEKFHPISPLINDCRGEVVDFLNITGYPTTIVFAPNGQQAMRGSGVWSSSTYNRIKEYLDQVR